MSIVKIMVIEMNINSHHLARSDLVRKLDVFPSTTFFNPLLFTNIKNKRIKRNLALQKIGTQYIYIILSPFTILQRG